jgi:hypothetical protein
LRKGDVFQTLGLLVHQTVQVCTRPVSTVGTELDPSAPELYGTVENLVEFQWLADVEAPGFGATHRELLRPTTTFGVAHTHNIYIYICVCVCVYVCVCAPP